ncbi:MAG: 6-phosphogluconolactonase [Bacteroidota bacterium]
MIEVLKIFETTDDLADYFARQLQGLLASMRHDHTFSLVLSGGTTPGLVFRKLASDYRNNIAWDKLKIFWGDERCVGPGEPESNYKMARENLLDLIPVPASNVFRIHGEAIPETEALRYSSVVVANIHKYMGFPSPDLVMLGIGEDGHTASIFPSDTTLFNSDRLFCTTVHPQTKQKRITACGRLINNARTVMILATGKSKAGKVAQVYNRKTGWESLPVSLVQPVHGELNWLLDREAASELNR